MKSIEAALRPNVGRAHRHIGLPDLQSAYQHRLILQLMYVIATGWSCYAVLHAFRMHWAFSAQCFIGASATFASIVWMKRRGVSLWPLRVTAVVTIAALSWATINQGEMLPAAGWWFSIVPFILAAVGMYYLAIGSIVAFFIVVSAVYLGVAPEWARIDMPVEVERWRRYAAVIGSELFALGLIIVAMRSHAFVTKVLDASRKATKEAMDTKSRFLSHISHEIRTPLNGIIGTIELLESPHLSADQRVQLQGIQRQSARTLLAMLNDVLDAAKLEAGKVTLEHKPLSLRELARDANELFCVQAYAKGIELTSSCDAGVAESFVGDGMRLRQIVNNLVANAVKFTTVGGVHIHVSMDAGSEPAAADPAGTSRVRIDVCDSGIGISEMALAWLFRPFSQGDRSTARKFGGTGLGLNISQELARLMGGRIEVQSSLGEGSCFSLRVPLVAEGPPATPRIARRRPDVVLVTANDGVERHVRSLLNELDVEPAVFAHLPTDAELIGCSVLLVDAPALKLGADRSWLERQGRATRHLAILTPLDTEAALAAPERTTLIYKPVGRDALEAVLRRKPESAREAVGAAEQPPLAPGRALHVLVADDNAVNQIVVQAMLAQLGATTAGARDGFEVLSRLQHETFDLVLMDMHMPGMNGMSATEELRRGEAVSGGPRMPVVAMTASCESESLAVCTDAGMDGFLSKPFGLDQLRRVLADIDSPGRARPSGSASSPTLRAPAPSVGSLLDAGR